MRLIDARAHMSARTPDEYRAMAAAGVEAVIEPATWAGQPRTCVGTFEDHFMSLLGWESHRAERAGVRHFCALGLNAREANEPAVAEGVLWLLPRLLRKDSVVAVGEVGFEDLSEAEEEAFSIQLELARRHGLPVIVRAPARDALRAVERSLALARQSGLPESMMLIDRLPERALPLVLDSGCWAGLSLHPDDGLGADAAVSLARRYRAERVLFGSGVDWDGGDPLAVSCFGGSLQDSGLSRVEVLRLLWENPASFFGQSGRLDCAPAALEAAAP